MSRLARLVNPLGIATLVVLVALWQLIDAAGLIHFRYIPSPWAIAQAAGTLISSGDMQSNLAHTLQAALIGWLIAAVAGIVIGTVIGLSRRVWTFSMASLDALRALPIVGFVPVAVLIFGFTLKMEVVVAAYAAIWPIMINTIAGMRAAHHRVIEVAHMLQFGFARTVWSIRLPAAVPYLLVGLRLGLSLSLVLTLVAEIVGNPAGLGQALVRAGQSLQPAQMFAYIVAIGIAGIVLNAVLLGLARLAFGNQLAAAGDDAS